MVKSGTVKENCNKDSVKAFLYKLRRNNILTWIERLQDINRYKDILSECVFDSILSVDSGVVRIEPSGHYIGHRFAPYVKHGIKFYELAIIMKYEIVEFEYKYGDIPLYDFELEELKQIVYLYNRKISSDLDINDKKNLIHLEDTAEVLHYLLAPSVILNSKVNGWCTLTFTQEDNKKKDYCTIFTEEQINLLERVNKLI